MLNSITALYRANPVRVAAAVVTAIVTAASALGIVVDSQSVGPIIAQALVILLGGEVARAKVTPTHP